MLVRELIERGYIVNLFTFYKDKTSDNEEHCYWKEGPIDNFLNTEIFYSYSPYFTQTYYFDISNDGPIFYTFVRNSGIKLTVEVPISVQINEEIKAVTQHFSDIDYIYQIVRKSNQEGKEISKRTQNAINKIADICSYTNYTNKELHFKYNHTSFSITFYSDTGYWDYIHKQFTNELRYLENVIVNLKEDLNKIDEYIKLTKEVQKFRDKLNESINGASKIIRTRLPILFKLED